MKLKEKDENFRIKLLKLVQESNTTQILADENYKEGLNDLMKYELIDIKNEKICITERGKRAQREGINTVIARLQEKEQPQLHNHKSNLHNPNNFIKYIGLLALILLLFVGMVFIFLLEQ